MNNLELRMYGLAIYQLMPIQAGIQFQHAVTRYSRKYQNDNRYIDWADNWQTSVVLNGGTTNLNPEKLGTINQYYQKLLDLGVDCEAFYEPDLGDQMTAIALILDERVFNKKKYPDFGFIYDELSEKFIKVENQNYDEWLASIGGVKIKSLRDIINPLPLWK